MLKDRWLALMDSLALPASLQEYDKLIAAYNEPHRRYHTLNHIEHMLDELAASRAHDVGDYQKIALAIWYHDAVYEPLSASNERQSAEWAKQFLMQHDRSSLAGDIFELVMSTASHQATTKDAAGLIDIDLSILGSSPERFSEFERQVREEYSIVPTIIYRIKRKAILQKFLQQNVLYKTDFFRDRYEVQARKNLSLLIESL